MPDITVRIGDEDAAFLAPKLKFWPTGAIGGDPAKASGVTLEQWVQQTIDEQIASLYSRSRSTHPVDEPRSYG